MSAPWIASIPLLLCPVQPMSAGGPQLDPLDLVEVELRGTRDRALLARFATDVDDHFHARDRARIFADDAEQARLERLGLRMRVIQEDLAAFYADRAEGYQYSGGGSFAGYRTYAELHLAMVHLAAQNSSFVSLPFSIGTSVEGRTIWAQRISSTPGISDPSKPTVWFDGLHHAREPIGAEAVMRFAEYLMDHYDTDDAAREMVDERNLLFIPCVNPDGYEFNRVLAPSGGGTWRKNMRPNFGGSLGVDLNRNYSWEWGEAWPGSSGNEGHNDYRGPSAFSEPESAALRDFAMVEAPDVSVSCHSYGGSCLVPWGYDSIVTAHDAAFRDFATAVAEPLGWTSGTPWELLGFANGTSVDYQYGTHGTLAFAFEIGDEIDGFWPAGPRIGELCDELVPAFLELARRAGSAPRLSNPQWTEVFGDGDEWREPGETWELGALLRNEGLRSVSGHVRLHAPAGLVELGTTPIAFDLAGLEELQVVFQVRLAPDAAAGEVYGLRVLVDSGGPSEELELSLPLGEGRLLALESCEGADAGWEVETSGAGAWECADPDYVLDANSGQITQPDSDASGIPGGRCWVTGAAGGGESSLNDVDGTVRLISPRFSAQGFAHLELDYRRWVTSLTSAGAQPVAYTAEVSNDDGASWTVLETVAHENTWTRSRLALEQFVPLGERMRLRFSSSDQPDSGLVESLVDELVLRTVADEPTLGAWGRTAANDSPALFLDAPEHAGKAFQLRRSVMAGSGIASPGIAGQDHLRGHVAIVASGSLDAEGRAQVFVDMPQPLLRPIGGRLHYQALIDSGGPQAAHSTLLSLEVD